MDKRAIIFDVDGVLVNSEALSCGALRQILMEEKGIDTGDDFSPVLGTSNITAIKYYLVRENIGYTREEVDRLADLKQIRYQELAASSLETFDHCEEFLEYVHKRYLVSVASSGSLEKIRFSLNKTGLLRFFEQLNSAEEVERGKPFPDLFELAMNRLDISPNECVIIEDSILGINAAIAAGADVYGFVGSFSREQLREAGATPFESYKELLDIFERVQN